MLGSLPCIWSINYNKRPVWCWMSDEVKSTCMASVWLCYEYEWHDVCLCVSMRVSVCLHTASPPLLSWSRRTLMPGLVTFSTSDSHGDFPSLKLFWVGIMKNELNAGLSLVSLIWLFFGVQFRLFLLVHVTAILCLILLLFILFNLFNLHFLMSWSAITVSAFNCWCCSKS